MGHSKGRDNAKKRAKRRKKTERLALAKKKRKPVGKLEHRKSVRVLLTGRDRMCALVATQTLARDLGKDLYRVDLGAVVSKYIGETEKNLRGVFHAARKSRAVLFLDEA